MEILKKIIIYLVLSFSILLFIGGITTIAKENSERAHYKQLQAGQLLVDSAYSVQRRMYNDKYHSTKFLSGLIRSADTEQTFILVIPAAIDRFQNDELNVLDIFQSLKQGAPKTSYTVPVWYSDKSEFCLLRSNGSRPKYSNAPYRGFLYTLSFLVIAVVYFISRRD
ncbi:MAG: hypothetical protein AAFN81_15295 [Bacteroidota bacterium]